MLEAGVHKVNSFLTLTYKVDPISLDPLDLRAFFDALRKRVGYGVFRYYAVGEYGDLSQRPHYHVAMFNYPTCLRPGRKLDCRCSSCLPIREAWGLGMIKNLPLEIGSARYIARYTIKKMTRTDDPRLGNRYPEFSRMSLKPGIGHGILDQLAATIRKYNLLTPQGDVPVTLRHGTQEMPLGRYLRKQLRKKLNLDERSPHVLTAEAAFAHYYSEENSEMRALHAASLSDPKNPSMKQHLVEASRPRRDQLERRHKLFSKKAEL